MICFSCGSKIEIKDRIGFRATCETCEADLHVCLNCNFYDPDVHNQCREPQVDLVQDKERANLCEYFLPLEQEPSKKVQDPRSSAKAELEKLFKGTVQK